MSAVVYEKPDLTKGIPLYDHDTGKIVAYAQVPGSTLWTPTIIDGRPVYFGPVSAARTLNGSANDRVGNILKKLRRALTVA